MGSRRSVHPERSIGGDGIRGHACPSRFRTLGVLLLALTLSAAGCAPPDTPPVLANPTPEAVLELLLPDTVRSARLGAGVRYRYLWSPEGPWAVHVVEADLTRCDLGLQVLRARDREEGRRGHETVTGMVSRAGGVLAAVNADFFTPEGATVGTEVVDGSVTAARERPGLSWRRGMAPWMGEVRVVGDSVFAGWGIHLGEGDAQSEVVGGLPELLDGGARVGDLGVAERPGFAARRHPRTAVGFDGRTHRLWMVVVDGRQPPHSMGMTLPELADLLVALGATDALNLDGGGSSVMVLDGRAVNRPSDETGERPVANGLALVRDLEGCAPRAR